jgi:hypothetical protein
MVPIGRSTVIRRRSICRQGSPRKVCFAIFQYVFSEEICTAGRSDIAQGLGAVARRDQATNRAWSLSGDTQRLKWQLVLNPSST